VPVYGAALVILCCLWMDTSLLARNYNLIFDSYSCYNSRTLRWSNLRATTLRANPLSPLCYALSLSHSPSALYWCKSIYDAGCRTATFRGLDGSGNVLMR